MRCDSEVNAHTDCGILSKPNREGMGIDTVLRRPFCVSGNRIHTNLHSSTSTVIVLTQDMIYILLWRQKTGECVVRERREKDGTGNGHGLKSRAEHRPVYGIRPYTHGANTGDGYPITVTV